MPCPSRARRGHALFTLFAPIVLAAFLAAPAVAGEIFKCVAKDGGPLYQNFPCNLDSLGWLPPSGPATKTPSNAPVAKTASMPGVPGQEKLKTVPIQVSSTVKSANASELRVGMTSDEVLALLGEPEEMVEDEPVTGRVSNWRYADGRILQFDHNHQLLKVQR